MKKYLFFDVDGTLYNSEKKLPLSAKEAIFTAKKNGHEVAIATGRAPFMIDEIIEELQIDTYVTFNGQYVVHKGEVIFTDGIEQGALDEIIRFGEERNHPVVFLDDERMVASVKGDERIAESLATLRYPYPTINKNYYKRNSVYQTLLFLTEEEQPLFEKQFPNIQFVRWHSKSCDLLPKKGSKARGIAKLCEVANICVEDVIAFGDGLNDVQMLEFAGVGVAMGNSHTAALKVADVITDHVDEDGLFNAMKKLQLI